MKTESLAGMRPASVPKDVVEAMHDLFEVIACTINEFTDAIDRAALRDAAQLVADVAIKHDTLGGYGVFQSTQEPVTECGRGDGEVMA